MSKCRKCKGKGWIYSVIGIVWYSAIRALPRFRMCKDCHGYGNVDGEDEANERDWDEMYKLHGLNKSINNRI